MRGTLARILRTPLAASLSFFLTAPFLIGLPAAFGQNHVPRAFTDLDQKIAPVLPTQAEEAFLQIPWRLNAMTARAESARTGKPMFLWEMNGHPLGHT